jgi:hypothetical protein
MVSVAGALIILANALVRVQVGSDRTNAHVKYSRRCNVGAVYRRVASARMSNFRSQDGFSFLESLTVLLVLCWMPNFSLAKGGASRAARTMERCDSIIDNLSGRTPCYTRRTDE